MIQKIFNLIEKKHMKDNIFIDTNIIIYAYSKTEIEKNKIANELIFSNKYVYISTQVINELINILLKKFKVDLISIENILLELEENFKIINFSLNTQKKAIYIKEKYKFQYYDSLIIATAIENNCSILYTEDMQHNQIIENNLKIINPFKGY